MVDTGGPTLEGLKQAAHAMGVCCAPPVALLIVAHPADYQQINATLPTYVPPESLKHVICTPTMWGIPIWKSPKIKRGKIRFYYTWVAAYKDLKDLLEEKVVACLKLRAEREVQK